MEKVIIVNLSKNIFKNFNLSDNFYRCIYPSYSIKNYIKSILFCTNNNLFSIYCNKVNVIISDYEFISPILEDKLKENCQFVELCINENEYKFYNFDESIVSDITKNGFCFYDYNDINKQYYLLIYRFLSHVL